MNLDDPFAAQDRAEHDKMVALAKGFEAKYVCLFLFGVRHYLVSVVTCLFVSSFIDNCL